MLSFAACQDDDEAQCDDVEALFHNKKTAIFNCGSCGSYWIRTSDPLLVRQVL